ncbi:MAG: pyridoxal-phosphate dependent enzyme [Acidimicrobiia bacterium]|nr:MAG: pyridoxal-phosphate dependent enzyme [Acidimicrobiia bacterium]
MTGAVTIDDVRAAADRIRPHIHRTPIVTSSALDAAAGATVFAKAENLQKVGAFKARGATNAVLLLDDVPGVATHSSGNHGQALAYAAGIRGLPAWIAMPRTANPLKIAAVRGYGAEVVLCDHADREQTALSLVEERGAVLVHPFDDADVIAGQGTVALELTDQVDDLDIIIAPIGGGGLLAGTAVAAMASRPAITVLGAEPFAVDDAYRSLASGERQPGAVDPQTVADGLLVGMGAMPFDLLSGLGVEILRVEEEDILAAGAFFLERMKLVVEPSSATALAAVFAYPDRFAGRRVGLIVSGGNTDLTWYRPSST